jgi:hypothetical protein
MAKVLFGMGVEGGIEDHLPEDLARGVEVGNGATPVFSRRRLSRLSRPFIGPILKARLVSN